MAEVIEFPTSVGEGFGERLRGLRKAWGVSRKKFAKQVRAECPSSGVSKETIVAWESGQQVPDAAQLQALAQLFRVSVRWVSAMEEPIVLQVEEDTDWD